MHRELRAEVLRVSNISAARGREKEREREEEREGGRERERGEWESSQLEMTAIILLKHLCTRQRERKGVREHVQSSNHSTPIWREAGREEREKERERERGERVR